MIYTQQSCYYLLINKLPGRSIIEVVSGSNYQSKQSRGKYFLGDL